VKLIRAGVVFSDVQAACESANTLQASALAGVNFRLHTAGWLEGGHTMGNEKFIMDDADGWATMPWQRTKKLSAVRLAVVSTTVSTSRWHSVWYDRNMQRQALSWR